LWEPEYRYFRLSGEERERVLMEIRRFLEGEEEVLLAVVFGSFVELESFRDIDVAVYSLDSSLDYIARLGAELEFKLGIPVDVVPLTELDPHFKLSILTRGRLVLEKTPGLYEALLSQAFDELQLEELERAYSSKTSPEKTTPMATP